MKTSKSFDEIVTFKKNSIRHLNNTIEFFLKSEDTYKKAQLVCKWLNEFSNYIRFEEKFDPVKNIAYHRGEVIKVNFGFNVGNELGGVHYAVVIDESNEHKSGVVTVLPMSSYKGDKRLHSKDLYIGSEFYTLLFNRASRLSSEAKAELEEIHKIQRVIEAASGDEAEQLRTDFKKKQKHINETIQLCGNCLEELKLMKDGSIVKFDQIRSISKMRIWNPRQSGDILYNIKLSDATMDKITERLQALFLHSR